MLHIPRDVLSLVFTFMSHKDACALQTAARIFRKRFVVAKSIAMPGPRRIFIVCRATVPIVDRRGHRFVGSHESLAQTSALCRRDLELMHRGFARYASCMVLDVRGRDKSMLVFGPPNVKSRVKHFSHYLMRVQEQLRDREHAELIEMLRVTAAAFAVER
jgi:hypothetical protein